jgi:hypothetical protein
MTVVGGLTTWAAACSELGVVELQKAAVLAPGAACCCVSSSLPSCGALAACTGLEAALKPYRTWVV